MTDPMTPLTEESKALLAEVHGTSMALNVFPARLRAIEQAAARRAIERVRAVASDLDSRGMGLAALSLLEVIESSAAIPRPEEPRVERWEWTVCGERHDPVTMAECPVCGWTPEVR